MMLEFNSTDSLLDIEALSNGCHTFVQIMQIVLLFTFASRILVPETTLALAHFEGWHGQNITHLPLHSTFYGPLLTVQISKAATTFHPTCRLALKTVMSACVAAYVEQIEWMLIIACLLLL